MVHLTTALDPASAVPLYEQLYRSLAAEMRAGTLTAGTRMPGKRRLAAELSISVNTVDTAYQMLAAEGYLTARERSGFTVQEYLALPQGTQPPAAPSAPTAVHPADTAPPVQFDLSTRGVDPGLFPLPHMGAAAKGTAILRAGAAHPGDAWAMPPCGRRWQSIWPSTGACSATRNSWWWAQGWNICWGCWHRCCPAPPPWRPPATPAPGRCWKTTACPAAACRWTRTGCR